MTKKAHSIELLEEALTAMGIVLSSIDVRRLHHFTRDMATRSATIKSLRNAVAQFRINPLKLLDIKGVGIKTLSSVQLLSDILAGQETQKEFGHSDNLKAVQSILSTMRRGVNDSVRTHIQNAANNLVHAQNMLQLQKMKADHEEFSESDFSIHTYINIIGEALPIQNIAGNIVIDDSYIRELVVEAIEELQEKVSQRHSHDKVFEIVGYGGEFTDITNDSADGLGCRLRVSASVKASSR